VVLAGVPSALALQGAGAYPGSFGLVPAIFDDSNGPTPSVFTVMKIANVGDYDDTVGAFGFNSWFCTGVTLHWYFIRNSDWSCNNKCIYMSCNDYDWFVFGQLVVGLLEFDYSQGGMSYFTVVNTPAGATSTTANSKYNDLNGVACGTVLLDYDAIKGEEFVLDVPSNLSWEIPIITYEGNDGYDGIPGNGVIAGDDGLFTYAPLGSPNFWEGGGPPKYFANYPDIFYIEWLPQDIVSLVQVCVPNQAWPFGAPGGVWSSEGWSDFFCTIGFFDYFDVRSWNDLEEPLPSVQPFTCFCWQVDYIGDITQLDLSLFGPNGGWTRETSILRGFYAYFPFIEGPGDIQVTIETVGAPFARGGDNYAGAYYTHHERTTTETVLDQCAQFPGNFPCGALASPVTRQ
jgi:hypothetical protein